MNEKLNQTEIDCLIQQISEVEKETKEIPSSVSLVNQILSVLKPYLKNEKPVLYQEGKEFFIEVVDLKNVFVNVKNLRRKM